MLRWGDTPWNLKTPNLEEGQRSVWSRSDITLRRCGDSAAGSGTCGGLCPVKQMQLRGNLQAVTAVASEAKDQM